MQEKLHYIKKLFDKYKKYFPEDEKRYELLENQIKNWENLWTRKNFTWHLTASAFILDKNLEKFVIIHNINLDKWLVPGGHREEGDGEMRNNAKREAMEETWLKDLQLFSWHEKNDFIPIDIDTHYIPENNKKEEPEHFHHDFRYIFIFWWDISDIQLQEQEVKWYKWLDINADIENFSWKDVVEKIKNLIN